MIAFRQNVLRRPGSLWFPKPAGLQTVYQAAVANGFDASFLYEHNLADLDRLEISAGLIDRIRNTSDDGTDAEQIVDLTDRPVYGQAQLNGIDIASFNNAGSQQHLDIVGPNKAGLAGAVAFTWFMVLRRQGALDQSGGRFWSNEEAGTPNGGQWQERNATTTSKSMRHTIDFVGDGSESVDLPAAVGTNWVQATCQWSPARGGCLIRQDRVDGEFNSNVASVIESVATTSAYGKRSNTASSNIAQFDLAQFALFNADLSNTHRAIVEQVMKSTWSLP